MNRFFALSAAALSLACTHPLAQAGDVAKKSVKSPVPKATSTAQPAAKVKAARAAALPVTPSARTAQLPRKAELPREVEAPVETPMSQAQLDIAGRVLTGVADCELNQTVRVEPQADRPGHFRVAFRNVAYTMVPEETSTGAVRLFDHKAAVMWLQIPTKSMLMDARVGQRVVDACMQPQQRIAAAAPPSVHASSGLGWSTPAPVAPAAPVLAASLALPAAQAAVPLPPVATMAGAMPASAPPMATLAGAPSGPVPVVEVLSPPPVHFVPPVEAVDAIEVVRTTDGSAAAQRSD